MNNINNFLQVLLNLTSSDIQELIFQIDPNIRVAYQLKDNYMHFNQMFTIEEALAHSDTLIEAFTSANIPEYSEFTGLLINWKKEIINSFTLYKSKCINKCS